MTPEQLHILQHSLGVDKYGLGEQYRNHFCPGGSDVDLCKSLTDLGFMEMYIARDRTEVYRVTKAGNKAMREESPKPPKVTKAQERYQEYLNFSDAYDISFKDWLVVRKTDWYKELKGGTE